MAYIFHASRTLTIHFLINLILAVPQNYEKKIVYTNRRFKRNKGLCFAPTRARTHAPRLTAIGLNTSYLCVLHFSFALSTANFWTMAIVTCLLLLYRMLNERKTIAHISSLKMMVNRVSKRIYYARLHD